MAPLTADCGLVYAVICYPTGRAYIGSTKRAPEIRWREHRRLLLAGRHHALVLQRAWQRHGSAAFGFHVVAMAVDSDLAGLEQQVIDQVIAERGRKFLLNAKDSAHPGVDFTDEVRAKMSARRRERRGHSYTPEQRKRISEAKKGKRLSDQHRAALRKAASRRPSKFSDRDKALIRSMVSSGASMRSVAELFGCHHKTVGVIAGVSQ